VDASRASSPSTRPAGVTDAALWVRPVDFGNPRDLDCYIALLDAYARDPMGSGQPLSDDIKARLRMELPRHPTIHALLAGSADNAAGMATCFLGYSTFRAQPLLNIHDIAVLPEWRGRSVARRLLDEIENLGRSLGCCRITLEVREDNQRARTLYAKAGFNPATCSLFMEKPL
jgi:ribosomal protein S18 acetylase RimI-like enzyme